MKTTAPDKKKKPKVKTVGEPKVFTEVSNAEQEKTNTLNQKSNETVTRFLFPKNPRAFKNLVEFSFANEEFIPIDQIDHTVFHLNLRPCIVLKDSDEGKRQNQLIKKKLEKANNFVTLKDQDNIFYNPKNCFDYVDRHVQTASISFKDESTKTEPQEVVEICDTVCQSIIYDAYLLEFQNLTNEEDKNSKDKYNDKKENEEKGKENESKNSDSNSDSDEESSENKMASILFSSITTSEKDSNYLSDDFDTEKSQIFYDDEEGENDSRIDEDNRNHEEDFFQKEAEEELEQIEKKRREEGEDNKSIDMSNDFNEQTTYRGHEGREKEEEEEINKTGPIEEDTENEEDVEDATRNKTTSSDKDSSLKNQGKKSKMAKGNKDKITLKGKQKKNTKEETSNVKRDMYFINYKDIEAKEHKHLNFIYHDARIKKNDKKILYKKSFLKTLKLMEKIYNKNNEEEIYLSYKNKNNTEILTKLWVFFLNSYQLVVTDIKFHPYYEDLFAISFKNNDSQTNWGVLSCFTFKNTKHPEYFIKTNFHIHSTEWSSCNLSIIAVGLSNGNICIYDLKKNKKERLLFESNAHELHHQDIISQMKFHQPSNTFYSVSHDGNIYRWKYNNKFTMGEKLLTLKKEMNDFGDESQLIHTQAITCIEFSPFQNNLFLIGTSKGKIYLYSSTYSDQCINSFNEHTMSINALCYNPFRSGVFISSSFDCSIRLWNQKKKKSLLVLDMPHSVFDVCWSTSLSTCFFVITGDINGQILIYDLSIDINKAVLCEIVTKKKKLRKICLNKFNDVLLIGEENGHVHSFKVSYNFNKEYINRANAKRDYNFQIDLMNSFLCKVQ